MMTKKRSTQQTVRDIRRATRRHYSAEEKFVLYLKASEAKTVLPNCAVEKALIAMCIIVGLRNSSKLVRKG